MVSRMATFKNPDERVRQLLQLALFKNRKRRKSRAAQNSQPPISYTSPSRYSFAATRFRFPTLQRAGHATNTFYIGEFVFATPDYEVTDPRFAFPIFFSPSAGGETAVANNITIEGISVQVGGVWYAAPSGSFPVVMNPASVPGALLAAIPVTIPANTIVTGRVAYTFVGNIPTVTTNSAIGLGEGNIGSTSTLTAKLTDGTAVGNSGGHSDTYAPCFMVAKGGDGRPAFIIVGDSIGFGQNESSSPVQFSSTRGVTGYIPRGLDDNVSSLRLAYSNFCVPGQKPVQWKVRSGWSKKLDLLKMVYDQEGAWPFDFVISQHGTNSSTAAYLGAGNLRESMETYFNLITAEWGKPITQVEILEKPTSTDGYATLANQSVVASADYPTGTLWLFNADVGGPDGLGDPTAYFRAGGFIEDSIAPWRYSSYDTGNNRDKLAIRPFSTTVASAYTSGSTIVLTDAPTVGAALAIGTTGIFYAYVTAVTGSGPYTVTFVNMSATSSKAVGQNVHEIAHDASGLHPSPLLHKTVYPQSVIDWKIRRGWI